MLSDSCRLVLEEIERENRKNKILNKSEITKTKSDKIEKSPNQVKISFLKEFSNPQTVINESDKTAENNVQKKVSIDTDSSQVNIYFLYFPSFFIFMQMYFFCNYFNIQHFFNYRIMFSLKQI